MNYEFRTVDVFSGEPFLGNPVAVIHGADDLTTEQMLSITRWMNLSETTFLLEPGNPGADYRVRIFTLDRELPFAGHPTLGSCRAWLAANGQGRDKSEIVQECGVGLVTIRQTGDDLAFAAPPLIRSGAVDNQKLDEVSTFLGLDRARICDAQWIDNGPGWLGVRLESAQAVLDVEPASRHPERIEVGLVGPWIDNGDADFEVRALFSDQRGAIIEDPVTGSLNAAIAQWLISTGQANTSYVALQGRRVGRRGRIEVSADDGEVWIGGAASVIVTGKMSV